MPGAKQARKREKRERTGTAETFASSASRQTTVSRSLGIQVSRCSGGSVHQKLSWSQMSQNFESDHRNMQPRWCPLSQSCGTKGMFSKGCMGSRDQDKPASSSAPLLGLSDIERIPLLAADRTGSKLPLQKLREDAPLHLLSFSYATPMPTISQKALETQQCSPRMLLCSVSPREPRQIPLGSPCCTSRF